jgi:hypothetical protein
MMVIGKRKKKHSTSTSIRLIVHDMSTKEAVKNYCVLLILFDQLVWQVQQPDPFAQHQGFHRAAR